MGWAAEPLEVWTRKTLEVDVAHLVALVREREVGRVVIGVPYRLDGSTGPSASRALAFIEALQAALPAGVPLITRDEALTSYEADERMKARGLSPEERKRWVDAYAASVILQDELDALSR